MGVPKSRKMVKGINSALRQDDEEGPDEADCDQPSSEDFSCSNYQCDNESPQSSKSSLFFVADVDEIQDALGEDEVAKELGIKGHASRPRGTFKLRASANPAARKIAEKSRRDSGSNLASPSPGGSKSIQNGDADEGRSPKITLRRVPSKDSARYSRNSRSSGDCRNRVSQLLDKQQTGMDYGEFITFPEGTTWPSSSKKIDKAESSPRKDHISTDKSAEKLQSGAENNIVTINTKSSKMKLTHQIPRSPSSKANYGRKGHSHAGKSDGAPIATDPTDKPWTHDKYEDIVINDSKYQYNKPAPRNVKTLNFSVGGHKVSMIKVLDSNSVEPTPPADPPDADIHPPQHSSTSKPIRKRYIVDRGPPQRSIQKTSQDLRSPQDRPHRSKESQVSESQGKKSNSPGISIYNSAIKTISPAVIPPRAPRGYLASKKNLAPQQKPQTKPMGMAPECNIKLEKNPVEEKKLDSGADVEPDTKTIPEIKPSQEITVPQNVEPPQEAEQQQEAKVIQELKPPQKAGILQESKLPQEIKPPQVSSSHKYAATDKVTPKVRTELEPRVGKERAKISLSEKELTSKQVSESLQYTPSQRKGSSTKIGSDMPSREVLSVVTDVTPKSVRRSDSPKFGVIDAAPIKPSVNPEVQNPREAGPTSGEAGLITQREPCTATGSGFLESPVIGLGNIIKPQTIPVKAESLKIPEAKQFNETKKSDLGKAVSKPDSIDDMGSPAGAVFSSLDVNEIPQASDEKIPGENIKAHSPPQEVIQPDDLPWRDPRNSRPMRNTAGKERASWKFFTPQKSNLPSPRKVSTSKKPPVNDPSLRKASPFYSQKKKIPSSPTRITYKQVPIPENYDVSQEQPVNTQDISGASQRYGYVSRSQHMKYQQYYQPYRPRGISTYAETTPHLANTGQSAPDYWQIPPTLVPSPSQVYFFANPEYQVEQPEGYAYTAPVGLVCPQDQHYQYGGIHIPESSTQEPMGVLSDPAYTQQLYGYQRAGYDRDPQPQNGQPYEIPHIYVFPQQQPPKAGAPPALLHQPGRIPHFRANPPGDMLPYINGQDVRQSRTSITDPSPIPHSSETTSIGSFVPSAI